MRRFPTPLLTIGRFAQDSGLSVSVLRFYDAHGLLAPASVDPLTGYRRYHPDQVPTGKLIAGMRRVHLPIADMAAILELHRSDPPAAVEILTGHLHRLALRLQAAQDEVGRLSAAITGPNEPLAVTAADLHDALTGVAYARGRDEQYPALLGVLMERTVERITAVATDRYRLASATLIDTPGGAPIRIVIPSAVVDQLLDTDRGLRRLPDHTMLVIAATDEAVTVTTLDRSGRPGTLLAEGYGPQDFPEVGPLLDVAARGGRSLAIPALRQELWELPEEVARVGLDRDGLSAAEIDSARGWMVSRALLWEALSTLGAGHLLLPEALPASMADTEVVGPLALQDESRLRTALVMPMLPESTAAGDSCG